MRYIDLSLSGFCRETFSRSPAPGGGGVAAAAGALGAALGGMVTSLTAGKKKYASVEGDIQRIRGELQKSMEALLDLVDRDAEDFVPVSRAYSLKGGTEEEKEKNRQILQDAMKIAAGAPADIVRAAHSCIPLLEELVEKGSSLAVSDVGCAAALVRSAVSSAWLNVLVNINSIADESFTSPLRTELEALVSDGEKRCDAVLGRVAALLAKKQ
jgi:formiminotetrahydrofolate cyclodeaminase